MSKEINLALLFKVLKNAWWKILIFTAVVAIIVAAVSEFVIPKKYSSSSEFYVLNTSTTSEYTTTALISAAEYLANDYIEIIHSDKMIATILADIADKGYTTVSPKAIRSMISSSTSAESSTFSITVTSTDKDLAFYICDSIKENSPKIIKDITRPSYTSNYYKMVTKTDDNGEKIVDYEKISEDDLECVKVIRSPEVAKSHVAPNVSLYTLVFAFLAACVAYAFFLVREMTDTVIRNEENAKDLINETVIGDIPNWTANNSARNTSEEQ